MPLNDPVHERRMILLPAPIPTVIFQYLCCLPTLHECHCTPLIKNNQPSLADSTNAITASRRTYPPTVHLIQHSNFNNFHNSRCCCFILSANSNVIAAARPAIPGHRTIVARRFAKSLPPKSLHPWRRTWPPTVHLVEHLNFNNFHNSGRCCCIILSANSNVIAARPAIPGHRTIVAALQHTQRIDHQYHLSHFWPTSTFIYSNRHLSWYCFCFLLLPAPRPPLATRQQYNIHASTQSHTDTEQKGSLHSRNGRY